MTNLGDTRSSQRRMSRVKASLLVALVASALAVLPASGSSLATPCAGSQLAGRFTRVAGSGAAGSVSYRLVLKNTSKRECTLTGLPRGRLRDHAGRSLPTHVRAAFPGALTAVLVRLSPGGTTRATARFSPDVPGPGEPVAGGSRCEPVAYSFRVRAQGGGTTAVPILPPTSVCEHGMLQFSAYGR